MTYGTVSLRIAFGAPGSAPAWTDVSGQVYSFDSRRGRSWELDRFEAGVGRAELDNRDGRFNPRNTAGPYYGSVLPMRRAQLAVAVGGTTYPVLTGYLSGWPQEAEWMDARCRVEILDAFKVFGFHRLAGTALPEERSDLRIGRLLDIAGWPAADRDLEQGQSTMQAGTAQGKVLTHLQDTQHAENGRLFLNGGGSVIFQDRHTPIKPPYSASQGTFDEWGGTALPYTAIRLSYDDGNIWNEVRVSREGGGTGTAVDPSSTAQYYTRTLERGPLPIVSDNECQAASEWLLARYRDPMLRVTALELQPAMDDRLWPQALGREIGDRITVVRRPPGGGTITQESIIEAIEHEARGEDGYWLTTFELSPADVQTYWLLGTSALGTDTRLGY